MIITKQFILEYKTDKGGWTQPQLEALGVMWPPTKGWMKRVIGGDINGERVRIFASRITMGSFRKSRNAN